MSTSSLMESQRPRSKSAPNAVSSEIDSWRSRTAKRKSNSSASSTSLCVEACCALGLRGMMGTGYVYACGEVGGEYARSCGDVGGEYARSCGDVGGEYARSCGDVGGEYARACGDVGGEYARACGDSGGEYAIPEEDISTRGDCARMADFGGVAYMGTGDGVSESMRGDTARAAALGGVANMGTGDDARRPGAEGTRIGAFV